MQKICFILILFCFFSCGNRDSSKNTFSEKNVPFSDSLAPIHLILPQEEDYGELYLSEIADSVSYLPLKKQTKDIRNIYNFNGNIAISSTGPISLFDTSGSFKYHIGGIGRGPEEYIQYRWVVNPSLNSIYVYSAGSKILKVFDSHGSFSHRIENSIFEKIDKIFYSGKNLVFSYPIEPVEGVSTGMELCLYNPILNDIIDSLPDYYGLNINEGRYGRYVYPISVMDIYNNQAFYMSKYADTLYRISEKEIDPYMVFNFGEYKYSIQCTKLGKESAQLSKKKIYPKGILVLKNAIYMHMFYTNEGEFSGTGYSFICKVSLPDRKVSYYKTRIINDLDNGPDYSIPLSYLQDFSTINIAAIKVMPEHYSYDWIVPQNECEKKLRNPDYFIHILNQADENSPLVLWKIYRKNDNIKN